MLQDATGSQANTENSMGNHRTVARRITPLSVLVLAPDGTPLNPCHPARARELLRKHRAFRICRYPFTIRLLPLNPDATYTPVEAL